MKQQFKSM